MTFRCVVCGLKPPRARVWRLSIWEPSPYACARHVNAFRPRRRHMRARLLDDTPRDIEAQARRMIP